MAMGLATGGGGGGGSIVEGMNPAIFGAPPVVVRSRPALISLSWWQTSWTKSVSGPASGWWEEEPAWMKALITGLGLVTTADCSRLTPLFSCWLAPLGRQQDWGCIVPGSIFGDIFSGFIAEGWTATKGLDLPSGCCGTLTVTMLGDDCSSGLVPCSMSPCHVHALPWLLIEFAGDRPYPIMPPSASSPVMLSPSSSVDEIVLELRLTLFMPPGSGIDAGRLRRMPARLFPRWCSLGCRLLLML